MQTTTQHAAPYRPRHPAAPTLSQLPTELIRSISHYLPITSAFSLSTTCKTLHSVLVDYLYERFIRNERDGNFPLWWASSLTDRAALRTAERAIRAGADGEGFVSRISQHRARGRDTHDETPLLKAVKAGNLEMIALLIRSGADPCAAGSRYTPMTLACQEGSVEVLEMLLLEGEIEEMRDMGDVQIARRATRRANSRCPVGASCLHYAVEVGHDHVLRLLLAHGARVDSRDADGGTPLMKAIMEGKLSTLKMLLDADADVLAVDSNGRDSLDYAVKNGHMKGDGEGEWVTTGGSDILRHLLDMRRGDEMSPLHMSELDRAPASQRIWKNMDEGRIYRMLVNHEWQSLETIQILLEFGIPLDARGPKSGSTALFWYAGLMRETLCTLGANGEDPSLEQRFVHPLDQDPEEYYLRRLYNPDPLDIARTLLDAGADVNASDTNGITPLNIAVRRGCWDMARLLLDRGADVHAVDYQGKSAFSLVEGHGTELARLIRGQNGESWSTGCKMQ